MPATRHRLASGEIVPGASTIAGLGKPAEPLIAWANKLGLQGINYRDVRDDAAKAGEIGHLLVEAAIKRRELKDDDFPTDGARELGLKAYAAYCKWEQSTKINWVDAELALVSETHKFGGRIDAIGIPDGSNSYVIGDWKTGGAYEEHLVQIAAYWHLFEECTGHAVVGAHLCRFNRLTGDFVHYYFDDLSRDWEIFLTKLKLYYQMREAKALKRL